MDSTTTSEAPAVSDDALWRLAYAIGGDRDDARRVVACVRDREAAGLIAPERLRGSVVALARRELALAGHDAGHQRRRHDRLWSALRPLPRHRRAQIVQRLGAVAQRAC